jgi:tetratricopeptide (TPR) repeat protein
MSMLYREAEPDQPRIPGYRLLRCIGEGGMGSVYEAEQENPPRRIAVKMLRLWAFEKERSLRLFQREAEAMGRLKHPGVVTIYESGIAPDGTPYLAMELVRGRPLDRFLRDEPPPASLRKRDVLPRLNLFLPICEAISYAHQNGVIHRDIKPSNILLLDMTEEADGVPSVKVLDFGLARFSEGSGGERTETGLVQGTLPYMSPEQVQGQSSKIDVRTDVYALGILLYRMLTGQHPYMTDNADLMTATAAILYSQPKPFREISPRYDEDLETITGKALAKSQEMRYQSVAGLIADLRRYLADQPIVARPPSAVYQIQKWISRNRVVFAAAAAACAALVVFVSYALFQAARIRVERDRANAEAATAREVSSFLDELLRAADPYENDGKQPTVRELLDRGKIQIDEQLKDRPQVRARLLHTLGRAYNTVGPPSEAVRLLREAVAIQTQTGGPDSVERAETLASYASALYNSGDVKASVEADREAARIREKMLPPTDPRVADSLNQWATGLLALEDYDAAEPILKRAIGLDRKAGRDRQSSHIWRLRSLGVLYRKRGDYAQSLQTMFDVFGSLRPEDSKLTESQIRNDLGIALNLMGRWEEAALHLRTSSRLVAELLGPDHANVALVDANLAAGLNDQARYAEAEAISRKAAAIFRKAMGRDSVAVWVGLADALEGQGKLAEAGDLRRKIQQMAAASDGKESISAAKADLQLGAWHVKAGRAAEGLKLIESAHAMILKLAPKSIDAVFAEEELGKALAGVGRSADAVRTLRSVRERLAQRLGANHYRALRVASALRNMGAASL